MVALDFQEGHRHWEASTIRLGNVVSTQRRSDRICFCIPKAFIAPEKSGTYVDIKTNPGIVIATSISPRTTWALRGPTPPGSRPRLRPTQLACLR